MNDLNWQKIETIIDRALEFSAEERKRFIDEQCGNNEQLKGEVTLLLESIADSEGWLEDPENYKKEFYEEISEDVESLASGQSIIAKKVGSYTIKEKIGEGGMGSVYLADRSGNDFDHQVAIKIIRSGKATDENIRRFKREQHILASLNHSGIARLFDGGVTSEGSPYIIMEYVNGIPIDEYCKKHNCNLDQKIELFKEVLEAVRHAHQNLVIHRDLKPGNILVDQDGNIKILDFGISKLLENEENTALTMTGTRLLTPRYAAPEQIKQQNITTATDLYALGIIFYQLLAGKQPFDFSDLSRYEMEQTILEYQPAKASTKVLSSKLKKKLSGDLDAIALKAIRKEPDKRYRVANEFLDDLKNYQTGIPVSAREDSFRYRSQKFLNRYKRGIVVVGCIVLLIIGFAGFHTWRITQERNVAEIEAQKAKDISRFLTNIFKSNDPAISKGDTLTAYELLNRGLQRIDQLKTPEVYADMLIVIGNAYSSLGFQDKAEDILDNAITENRNVYGYQSTELAKALFARGIAESLNFDVALPFFRESYQIRKTILGKRNPATLRSMERLATSMRNVGKLDSAEYFAKKVNQYKSKNFKGDSLKLVASMGSLAYIYRKQDKTAEAKQIYLQIIHVLEKSESNENALELSTYYNNLAFIYRDTREYQSSEKYLRKSLTINEKIRGKGHPTTLMVRGNLAANMKYQARYEAAFNLLKQNIRYAQKKYSENHWRTASKYEATGNFLIGTKRYGEAESYLIKSIDIYNNTLGPNHIWTSCAEGILAADLYFIGKKQEADILFAASFKKLKQTASNFRAFNKDQVQSLINLYKNKSEKKYKSQITSLNTLLNPSI